MENETPKPNPLLHICVLLCLPFAKLIYVILMTGLYLAAFLIPAGMAYEHFITPEILRDVPVDYNFARAQPRFEGSNLLTKRLKEKYPDGTQQKILIEELILSGFDTVNQDNAYFAFSDFPCLRKWSVRWQNNEDGTISAIQGTASFTCL